MLFLHTQGNGYFVYLPFTVAANSCKSLFSYCLSRLWLKLLVSNSGKTRAFYIHVYYVLPIGEMKYSTLVAPPVNWHGGITRMNDLKEYKNY